MNGNSISHSLLVQLFNKICILCKALSSAHWIQKRQRDKKKQKALLLWSFPPSIGKPIINNKCYELHSVLEGEVR